MQHLGLGSEVPQAHSALAAVSSQVLESAMSALVEGDVFGSSVSSLLDSHLLCRLLCQAAVKAIARVGLSLEEEVGRRTWKVINAKSVSQS